MSEPNVKPDVQKSSTVTTVERCFCLRCGNDWLPRKPGKPATCSKCRSRLWDQPKPPESPKKKGKGGRPKTKVSEKDLLALSQKQIAALTEAVATAIRGLGEVQQSTATAIRSNREIQKLVAELIHEIREDRKSRS